jgi:hypothetical protein
LVEVNTTFDLKYEIVGRCDPVWPGSFVERFVRSVTVMESARQIWMFFLTSDMYRLGAEIGQFLRVHLTSISFKRPRSGAFMKQVI